MKSIEKAKEHFEVYMNFSLGTLRLVANEDGLCAVQVCSQIANESAVYAGLRDCSGHPILTLAVEELTAYFAGKIFQFTVPLSNANGTAFQRKVWESLTRIPYGETCSYTQQATAIGRPSAVRAVGAANGRNPLCIVVPCHRVIAANGKLQGYAGGLAMKEFLLKHEQSTLAALSESV